jgi:hypothetical protein
MSICFDVPVTTQTVVNEILALEPLLKEKGYSKKVMDKIIQLYTKI